MAELKLIHGKQSVKYDHFREFDFESCRAVCTRLMGVVALKVTWRGMADRRERMYQVIHLDYSEYGIDEYQEFICTPGNEDFAEKKEEMTALWNHFVSVMGGQLESIDEACMLRLIEDALPLASEDVSREYDSEENREFRSYARLRLGLMQDALNCRGITSADCSSRDAIETTSPLRLSAYETINYFIMRLVDSDFAAASYLSSMKTDGEDPFTNDGVLAAIGMERRKHAYRLGHLTSPKLFQQIVQLLWSMILSVNLSRNLQCLLRQLMKHHVDITTANDGFARCHVITKFLYCHILSVQCRSYLRGQSYEKYSNYGTFRA